MARWLRSSVCSVAIFFSAASALADNATFLWNFGTCATPSTSTAQNPTGITFNSTGIKPVTLTIFGCDSSRSITKNVNVVSVISGKNNNQVIICHKGKMIVVAQSALQAHLAHGDCLGACSNVNGRISADEILSTSDETEINISPNPFYSSFKVVIKSQKQEAILIELFNTMGQKITSISKDVTLNGEYEFEINIGDLPTGIYILTIHTTTEDRYIKLVRAP